MRTLEQKERNKKAVQKYHQSAKGKEVGRKANITYRKNHPEHRFSTRKNNSASYRSIIIDFLVKRDGLICGICKESLEASKVHIDHIIPVALGGLDIMDNVQLAHPECNMAEALSIRKQSHGY